MEYNQGKLTSLMRLLPPNLPTKMAFNLRGNPATIAGEGSEDDSDSLAAVK